MTLFPLLEALPQRLIAARQGRQTVQEPPKIKPCPADHHRQPSARGNVGDHLAGLTGILPSRVTLLGVEHVEQMMGYSAALRERRLGRTDIEAAIELEGVAID